MPSETLAHARYYLSRGMHPIPVEPRGKKPTIKWEKYQSKAPTDAELVKWFASGEANIGLVLGRGMIAVDLDGEGAEDLLTQVGIELPETAPRGRTGGGFHVFLKVNEPVGNRARLLAAPAPATKPAIDIRGDGGYVVAPPSVHPSGAVYEWIIRPDTLPDAPQALLTLMTSGTLQDAPGAAQPSQGATQDLKWVTKALLGVGEGQRDATCAKLAGYFLKKQMPPDVVKATLRAWADRCTPPFPHAEVDKTVQSVQKRELARAQADAADPASGAVNRQPFQVLGYNQGSYFYLPGGSRQVVELRPKHHTKLDLLSLAPYAYWERAYPGESGPRWDFAANALIRKCEAVGVYDTSRIRGRGAWWDDDRAVLHLGDRIIAEGKETPIMEVTPGRYIYEAAPAMPVAFGVDLSAGQARRVIQLCELANWERPISAKLFAGWIAVAPICGALSWRPHIWLTGPAGSGKTWMIDHIARRLLGHIALAVQSETTEAGLRQTLGNDARPIIFDEAEGENERAQMRIQNILALMRQASSETGSTIVKGSPLGVAKSYRIRSCFAFSSIGVGVQQHADATRVSVLSVEKRHDPVRFARLSSMVTDTLTEDFVQAFNARAIRLIPVIRANARTFASAGAAAIGSQRLGDQIGALLAGAYSLHSDELITPDAAVDWVGKQDWSEQQVVNEASDESLCLNKILEATLKVPTSKGLVDRSIGELIEVAAIKRQDGFTEADALNFLLRIGIRVERGEPDDVFIVANEHTGIARILNGTVWARGWKRILRRVKGAQATEMPIRFAGVQCRGTAIPLEMVCGQAVMS